MKLNACTLTVLVAAITASALSIPPLSKRKLTMSHIEHSLVIDIPAGVTILKQSEMIIPEGKKIDDRLYWNRTVTDMTGPKQYNVTMPGSVRNGTGEQDWTWKLGHAFTYDMEQAYKQETHRQVLCYIMSFYVFGVSDEAPTDTHLQLPVPTANTPMDTTEKKESWAFRCRDLSQKTAESWHM